VDDQFHSDLFAMEERAMMLGEIAFARGTVELAPGAAIGMPCTIREERRVQLSVE
jgi:hypothetical protein